MGIVALLMLMAASGLTLARDQYMADQTAEELLTTIREAQNKSISISRDSQNNITKVWAVEVGYNNFNLLSYFDGDGEGLNPSVEKSSINPQRTTIATYVGPESAPTFTANPTYIFYNTPFGKGFVTTKNCTGTSSTCIWSSSQRPTEEWILPTPNAYVLTNTQMAKFVINKNGKTATVVVKGNGDAYIE